MSNSNRNKLNQLLAHWPAGTVKTAKKLVLDGYSHVLQKKYVDSGWIEPIAQGAFSRKNDKIEWVGALSALQIELRLPVHLGGLSALSLLGMGQYIPFNEQLSFYNTSAQRCKLPKWFTVAIPNAIYYQYHIFDKNQSGYEQQEISHISFQCSKPERALLECLAMVPHLFDFQHASELLDNSRFLDPAIMQTLLEDCRSFKVKRLFLYFADHFQLPCFSHLNLKRIDLGKGKRKIGDGGQYHAKYLISVPTLNNDNEAEV